MAKLAEENTTQKVELSLMGDLRKEFDSHEELNNCLLYTSDAADE